MKIQYVCEICEAKHSSEADALNCEQQGFHPNYEIGNKAIYCGAVVTISRRSICLRSHDFIYMFDMNPKDNPGKTLSIHGWKSESELRPYYAPKENLRF